MIARLFRPLIAAAALLLMAAPASAGEKAFGIRAGFNTRNSAPMAGLWFQYSFNSHFRLAPNVDYHFRHNHTDALAINCNAQFPFALGSSRLSAYPLFGLNYTSWNYHRPDAQASDDNDDVTTRLNRFGTNLGAGLELRVTPTMKITLEAKTTLIKSYSSGTFSVGLGYCF